MNRLCAHIILTGVCLTGLSAKGWAGVGTGVKLCPAPDSVVIRHLDTDVTGDGVTDRVMLMGRRFDESGQYMVDLSIEVTDLDGREIICKRLPKNSDSGYDPQLSAMDFTGDGFPDAFVSAPTGGSGGITNYIIYSLKDRNPGLLLDSSETIIPEFRGKLLTNYKAKLTVDGATKMIDLKSRKSYYDKMGYYKKGKLVKPTDLWSGGYGLITPVDNDNDGIYELRAVRQVKGIANIDTIADITSLLKWKNGKWVAASVAVSEVGP